MLDYLWIICNCVWGPWNMPPWTISQTFTSAKRAHKHDTIHIQNACLMCMSRLNKCLSPQKSVPMLDSSHVSVGTTCAANTCLNISTGCLKRTRAQQWQLPVHEEASAATKITEPTNYTLRSYLQLEHSTLSFLARRSNPHIIAGVNFSLQ